MIGIWPLRIVRSELTDAIRQDFISLDCLDQGPPFPSIVAFNEVDLRPLSNRTLSPTRS